MREGMDVMITYCCIACGRDCTLDVIGKEDLKEYDAVKMKCPFGKKPKWELMGKVYSNDRETNGF